MKICPFCAEEIQDAAIVCKHCGRELTTKAAPAPTRPPEAIRRREQAAKWVIISLVGAGALMAIASVFRGPASPVSSAPSERLLKITVARSPRGISFTNQENSALSRCVAHVTDREGTVWVAQFPHDLVRLETAGTTWDDFKAAGQSMPGYIGRDRGVIIACDVEADRTRRSASVTP